MSTIRKCIVKESSRIRKLLKQRFDELKYTNADVVKDARSRGLLITSASLGRFMKDGNARSTISQEDVVWLCFRYAIEIQLLVGSPKVEDGKIKLFIPAYNEQQCLKYLDKYIISTKNGTSANNPDV